MTFLDAQGNKIRSHLHSVLRKFWFGQPYYWCESCGVAAIVRAGDKDKDPQDILDAAGVKS
jgi:hypothetical protein